jgi:sugar phosphate isomerase/epimerase
MGICGFAAKAAEQNGGSVIQFPSKPQNRLAVTSYPFRAYIESPTNRGRRHDLPGMDLTQFPAMVAEKFGVYNVNPLIDHFRSTEPAYIDKFRRSLTDAHSHIVDLGLPGRPFYSSDRTVRQSAVESGQKWVQLAQAVGSPSVRQHISSSGNGPADVNLAAESLAQLAEYGGKHGVVINLENDSPVAEDPFFLIQVINKVDNPYLRALPDFGNSLVGHNDEYNRKAVSGMFTRVFNMCHVKDKVTSSGQIYNVNLDDMFGIAEASGYRGYFSMEFDTNGGDPFSGTRQLVEATLKHLT